MRFPSGAAPGSTSKGAVEPARLNSSTKRSALTKASRRFLHSRSCSAMYSDPHSAWTDWTKNGMGCTQRHAADKLTEKIHGTACCCASAFLGAVHLKTESTAASRVVGGLLQPPREPPRNPNALFADFLAAALRESSVEEPGSRTARQDCQPNWNIGGVYGSSWNLGQHTCRPTWIRMTTGNKPSTRKVFRNNSPPERRILIGSSLPLCQLAYYAGTGGRECRRKRGILGRADPIRLVRGDSYRVNRRARPPIWYGAGVPSRQSSARCIRCPGSP